MARIRIDILHDVGWGVEDLINPQTGKTEGKRLNFVDQDDGNVVQVPLADSVAKQMGQQLMGIGQVQPATAQDLTAMTRNKGRT